MFRSAKNTNGFRNVNIKHAERQEYITNINTIRNGPIKKGGVKKHPNRFK